MVVVLNDWPFGPQIVDSWVREQLISLGLDPDGVDNAQLWSSVIIRSDSERTVEMETEWLVAYSFGAVVEHTCPQFGTHTTLYSCPVCHRLTSEGVCPHCGADIVTDKPSAEYQSAEDIESWFAYDTPGMIVQFRCEACDQFFGVEGAINHAQETGHTRFYRA